MRSRRVHDPRAASSSPSSSTAVTDDLERLERSSTSQPVGQQLRGRPHAAGLQPARVRQALYEAVPVHEQVLPIVEGVLDPGCLVSSLSSITILPGETAQPIHADDQLIPLPKPHVPTVCNTMWALTDFTEANGATRVIPGTHTADASPDYGAPYDSIAGRDAAGQRARVAREPVARRRRERDRRRRGSAIAMNYCAGWIRQQENQQLGHPPRDRGRLLAPAATARGLRHLHRPHRPHRQARPGRDARRRARRTTRWCGTRSVRVDRRPRHMTTAPPSTANACPTTNDAASDSSHTIACGDLLGSGQTTDRCRLRHHLLDRRVAAHEPSSIGVRVLPGQTALIRTPAWTYSSAAARVSPMTPCLLATYAGSPAKPTSPAPDDVLTIASAPVGDHRRDLVLQAEEHAGEVEGEHPVPVLERVVGRLVGRPGGPGVVDRPVEAAPGVERHGPPRRRRRPPG